MEHIILKQTTDNRGRRHFFKQFASYQNTFHRITKAEFLESCESAQRASKKNELISFLADTTSIIIAYFN